MAQTAGLGHVGIYAHDLMKMRDFYTRVIGLQVADEDLEGRGMCFLSSGPGFGAPRVCADEGPEI